ncbi:site-2 protease family protein [Qaidamihabitans albus]|uniref:site-2 protease family protein n=1 Tax=Qaidamihabitans albus TaxID=2795733 RepID=UPI0018F18942|nr:site-2 protease family protein [Qaidamihabitans albus]
MFRGTVPLGHLGGVRLGAHWSVAVVVGLIAYLLASSILPAAAPGLASGWYWVAGVLTAACFMASLLAHELSHAVTARHHGVPVAGITLWMLGGAAELEGEPPDPRTDFLIAAAGPASSLLIGGVCWAAAAASSGVFPPIVVGSLLWLGLSNIALAVFNLLPGAPLDGGRLVRAAVWKRTGDRRRAVGAAAKAGQVLGTLLVVAGFTEVLLLAQFTGLWLALIGWFLIGAAAAERAHANVREQLADMPVRAIMSPDPVIAPGWLTVEAFLERIAFSARHRTFPVVSFEGAPIGVLSLSDLARLTPEQQLTTRVSDVCRTPPRVAIVPASTPLTDILTHHPLRPGADLLLVTDNATLAGVVSAQDVTRTVELAMLHHRERR